MNPLLHHKGGALHYCSAVSKPKEKKKRKETKNKQFNYSSSSLLLCGAHLL